MQPDIRRLVAREEQVAVVGVLAAQGHTTIGVHAQALGQELRDSDTPEIAILDFLQRDEIRIEGFDNARDTRRVEATVAANTRVHVVAGNAQS